jgi:hypothetical protein
MKILILLSLFITLAFQSISQNSTADTIDTDFKSYVNFKGQNIAYAQMKILLRDCPASQSYQSNSGAMSAFAQVLAGIGGFGIGYPIGSAIGGKNKPIWAMAAVGAGLIGLAIPLAISATKSQKKAVAAFNEYQRNGTKPTSFNLIKMNLVIHTNSVGLVFNL